MSLHKNAERVAQLQTSRATQTIPYKSGKFLSNVCTAAMTICLTFNYCKQPEQIDGVVPTPRMRYLNEGKKMMW